MTDRTAFFRELTANVQESSSHARKKAPQAKRTLTSETAHFGAASSDISKEVHLTSQRLQQLTKLVRQNNMFNDPTQEINQLTSLVKEDIANINMQLDNLQTYVNDKRESYSSKQAAVHSEAIVSQMKSNLMKTTKGFKDILEVRQENMKLQQHRRSRYGKSSAISLGKPLAFNVPAGNNNCQVARNSLPRPDGVVADDGMEATPLIPLNQNQLTVENDQGYLEARGQAVSDIQSHIVELGQIFNRLAVMVSEQGDMVQRVDDNVEDTLININAGQNELLKYFNTVSSNKLLGMKIFGILLIFIVFFMFFLA